MATTPNYSVNYDDKRFTDVKAEEKAALSEVEQTYGGMINESDKYYQAQIDASKQWADKQTQLQQEQTDFAIEQIEQQKDQTKTDYLKEQSGAYVDWQKQANQYGANAEQMAAQGMANTGFSESSQVSMYNTYQNRVATARESYNRAVLNYDNAIKDARLQNNSVLAEIAYQALQTQFELSLEGFQHKNQLLIDQANKKLEVSNTYYQRYQDVLNQINTENALAEEVRQFNQTYDLQLKEFEESVRQYNQNYDLQVKQLEEEIRQFDEEIARLKAKDAQEYKVEIQKLELQKDELELKKDQLKEEQRQFNETMAEEKRQFNVKNTSSSSKITKTSSGSSKVTKPSTTKKTNSKGSVNAQIQADKNAKNTKSSSAEIDMQSVLKLGYGPISASRLSELVNNGVVEQYTSGGKIKFRKSKSTLKQEMLLK